MFRKVLASFGKLWQELPDNEHVLPRNVAERLVISFREFKERLEKVETSRKEFLELSERMEVLEASHMRMLRRYAGRSGGRPIIDGETIDSIPVGDKDGLRRHFAGEIARRGPRKAEEL